MASKEKPALVKAQGEGIPSGRTIQASDDDDDDEDDDENQSDSSDEEEDDEEDEVAKGALEGYKIIFPFFFKILFQIL